MKHRNNRETDKIEDSLVELVNDTYRRFCAAGDDASAKLIEYVNLGREVGLFIESLAAKDKSWEQLLLADMADEPKPGQVIFTLRHAKTFRRVPQRLLEPAANTAEAFAVLKDALYVAGELEWPDGHGAQKLHAFDPSHDFIKAIMVAQAIFGKSLADEVDNWTPERRHNLADQLEPLVRIHGRLSQ